ncbi:MAG: biopolymer transporter ExbD [Bacteroidia bacterium]|nr:biopolymer transporter ExbD [Bacteroidia bacterium]
MNFRRKKYVHAEVQAGALSDILFFLMLFFLIISTLASPNAIKLLLPHATSGRDNPSTPVSVSITADLRYYIENEEVNITSFENTLSLKIRGKDKPSVVLRMDKSIEVNEMMKIMDILHRMKVPVVIAVDKGAL